MTIFESIILGFIQGVTEFIPISSSGHLILVPYLFGWKPHVLSIDIILHLGTLFVVLIYFFFDWVKLIKEGILSIKHRTLKGPAERLLFWYIVIATIPAAICGKLLEDKAESAFRNPVLVAVSLGVFALVFYLAQKISKNIKSLASINFKDALLIGIAQSFAILPGVSRSGATITSGIALGLKREEAVRFSFLLSMPIILGAGILKIKDIFLQTAGIDSHVLWIGFFTSLISGILSIHFLLKFVKKYSFSVFILYRIILCLIVIGVFLYR